MSDQISTCMASEATVTHREGDRHATIDGDRTSLLTEEIPGSAAVSIGGVARHDVARNSQKTALIGDPRNDENLIVSQLHLALERFHNRVVVDVSGDLGPGFTTDEILAEAQRVLRWHYQWLIIQQFLVTTVGAEVVEDILVNGPKHFAWRNDP
jgi:Animal haem peroxidase